MKKIILLILSLCMLSSCGTSENSAEAEPNADTFEVTDTTTAVTTETTTETTAEPELESQWALLFYVDDFKRETDDPFIFGEFYGTFSNSETYNSDLSVTFSIERFMHNGETIYDGLRITLYEYGTYRVNSSYSDSTYYEIQVLEENDNIIQTIGVMLSGNIMFMEDKDQNPIINALKNNNTLVFRIDEKDDLDSYFFEVDCTGFKELFESTNWKV